MSSKTRIGLLSPFLGPIRGYEEAAAILDLDLVIVTPGKIDWKSLTVHGLIWSDQSWILTTIPIPDAFYNRYYGPKPKTVDRLEAIIGKNKVFNHITRFDKWALHQLFSKSPLKQLLPATAPFTTQTLFDFLERFGQVILKPAEGQLGVKVYLLRKEQQNYYLHQGAKSPIASFHSTSELLTRIESLVSQDFLVQQFIPLATVEGRVFDLRCLVQKDELGVWQVTGTLSRIAFRYSYITNVSQSIVKTEDILQKAFPTKDLLPELMELSLKGAQIAEESLGSLGELSVDFGLDHEGRIWIIELNAKPMKSMFEALGDHDLLQKIYQQPLSYALHLVRV